ncbi:hypothetical protein MPSEU_000766300 [Mayamaea pseudoterrestris]|nr:hypothetical protein MPSEU_000766300 [Mayamaea pseudoterrestris]
MRNPFSSRDARATKNHDDDDSQHQHEHTYDTISSSSMTDQDDAYSMAPSILLRRKTSAPSWSSYQTTPITKLYELNQRVLVAFDSSLAVLIKQQSQQQSHQTHLHQTLAMGLQFVETAIVELPKHGYYLSKRHERDRMQSCLEAVRVTRCLQQDVLTQLEQQANEAPTESLHNLMKHVQKLSDLALWRVQEASQDQAAVASAKVPATSTTSQDSKGNKSNVPAGDTNASASASSSILSCEPLSNWDWVTWCQELPDVLQCPPTMAPPPASAAAAGSSDTSSTTSPALFGTRPVKQSSLLDDSEYVVVERNINDAASSGVPQDNHDASSILESVSIKQAQVTAMRRNRSRQQQQQQQQQQQDHEVIQPAVSQSTSTSSSSVAAVKPVSSETSSTAGSVSTMRTRYYRAPQHQQQQQSTVSQAKGMEERRRLEQALYLSGWDATSTTSMDASASRIEPRKAIPRTKNVALPTKQHKPAPDGDIALDREPSPTSASSALPFETLAKFYHEDFDQLRSSGHVRISFANTYQGRIPGSTNGCTVIAPLLCIHHLLDHQVPDPGLPDAVIQHVIDDETPAILSQLRNQLGLSEHAFLIPSDAHEYLIENGQLSQDQFFDVIGGNVLDDDHLLKFVTTVQTASNHKVAACLFFHEHVITILKLQRDDNRRNTSYWYDVIDGLPLKETLGRIGQSDDSLLGALTLTESESMLSHAFLPKTARIRCLTAEALTACLRWYACSKFTPENVNYIDQYAWSDNSCDFDPRVFQGFVWGSIDQ